MPLDGLLYPKRQPPWLLPAGQFELDRAHPLANGLVGCWPLYAGDPRDYSNTGAHGKIINGVEPGLLAAGPAAYFRAGNSNCISIGQPPVLNLTTKFTVSAWVRQVNIATSATIVSKGYDGSSTQWGLTASGATPSFGMYNGSSHGAFSAGTLSNGVIYHLLGTYDGTTWRLYINGKIDTTTADLGPNVTAQEVEIGAVAIFGNPGQFFDGYIWGVNIWNRVLGAAEVASLYAEPFAMLRPVSRRALTTQGVPTIVNVDATATTLTITGALTTSATNSSLTVGVGATALLAWFQTGSSVVSPVLTWDSGGTNQAMTIIGSTLIAGGRCYLFGLLNPTPGNNTLAASWSGSANCLLDAISFTGTDNITFANAFRNFTSATPTGTSGTITVPGTVGNIQVVGGTQNSYPFAAMTTTGSTEVFRDATHAAGIGCRAPSAASLTWTASTSTSTQYALVGVDVSAPGVTGTLNVTQADQTLAAAGTVSPAITGILGGSTTPVSTVGGATPSGTVLLLHADGANGSTTFVDNSPSAHTLTVVGPAQVSTAAAYFGTGGLDTSASGGFGTAGVNTNNATDFNFGAGPFTIEAWCYVTVPFGSNNYAILAQWGGGGNQGCYITVGSSAIRFTYSTTGSNGVTAFAAYAFPLNTWVHVAVDRDASNNIRIYVNGVVQSTTAAAATIFPSTANAMVGVDIFNESFGGYLDEVLVMKGYAKYAGAFTPPAAPYGSAASPSCVLLVHGDYDGVSGSHVFDNSPSGHTLTVTSAAGVQTSAAKFGNAALWFPNTSSFINTNNATDFNFGAGPFTIEAWGYFTSLPNRNNPIIAQWGGGWFLGLTTSNMITFYWSTTGSDFPNIQGTFTFSLNTWYHIAVDRDATGMIRLYVNGTVITFNNPGATFFASTNNCYIGNDISAGTNFSGYLDEVRVTKGRAMYAGAFSPPLAPFVASNTVLLIHADGANGSTAFIDSSVNANTLTAAGTAQVTTANQKFGTGSLDLHNSIASWLNTNNAADFNFGAGPFTIEAWVYITANPTAGVILAQWAAQFGVFLNFNNNSISFQYSSDGSTGFSVVTSYTPPHNTWYHLAVDRDASNVLRVYANGVVLSSQTFAVTLFPSTDNAIIGNLPPGFQFPGQFDEIRVSKGVARFAGAFTPPTQAYAGDAVVISGLTQADQTLSAAGTVGAAGAITGALNVTQANQTLVAADTVVVSGTLNVTQANQTLAAFATLGVSGTLAATQANQTLGATATPVVGGALNILQANQTLAATAVGGETGALSLTQADQTLAAAGTLAVVGALSLTQANQTLVASASLAALAQTRVVIMA